MDRQAHILVIDDDERLRQLLSSFLRQNNYIVSTTGSTEEADLLLKKVLFDALIIDIMLPGEDGLSFMARNRENFDFPVILLTAKGTTDDRIQGLEKGADDYLTKPFEPRELLLRLQNLLERQKLQKKHQNRLSFGEYEYDLESKVLFLNDQTVDLTTSESRLLGFFIENANKTLDRYDLAQKCSLDPQSSSLDVLITRLRKKIEKDSTKPNYIKTEHRKGYKFILS